MITLGAYFLNKEHVTLFEWKVHMSQVFPETEDPSKSSVFGGQNTEIHHFYAGSTCKNGTDFGDKN